MAASRNIGQPEKYVPDTYVRVLLLNEYNYRIACRIALYNLTILAATLVLWIVTMLYYSAPPDEKRPLMGIKGRGSLFDFCRLGNVSRDPIHRV